MRKLKRRELRRFLEIKLNLINNEIQSSPGEISFGSLDLSRIPCPAQQYKVSWNTLRFPSALTFSFSSLSCPSPPASRHILPSPLTSFYLPPNWLCHFLMSTFVLLCIVFRKTDPEQQWVHFHFEPGISVSQHLFKDSKQRNHSWFFHCCSKPHVHTNEKCTDFF